MSRRLRIMESNYGRTCGWSVEVGGRTVAVLTDCRFEDMFWDSYRVEPATAEALVLSEDFWNRLTEYRPVFRDRTFGEVARPAFAAWREPGSGVSVTGRVSMRGLYLIAPEYPWDGLVLWLRRLSRRACTCDCSNSSHTCSVGSASRGSSS